MSIESEVLRNPDPIIYDSQKRFNSILNNTEFDLFKYRLSKILELEEESVDSEEVSEIVEHLFHKDVQIGEFLYRILGSARTYRLRDNSVMSSLRVDFEVLSDEEDEKEGEEDKEDFFHKDSITNIGLKKINAELYPQLEGMLKVLANEFPNCKYLEVEASRIDQKRYSNEDNKNTSERIESKNLQKRGIGLFDILDMSYSELSEIPLEDTHRIISELLELYQSEDSVRTKTKNLEHLPPNIIAHYSAATKTITFEDILAENLDVNQEVLGDAVLEGTVIDFLHDMLQKATKSDDLEVTDWEWAQILNCVQMSPISKKQRQRMKLYERWLQKLGWEKSHQDPLDSDLFLFEKKTDEQEELGHTLETEDVVIDEKTFHYADIDEDYSFAEKILELDVHYLRSEVIRTKEILAGEEYWFIFDVITLTPFDGLPFTMIKVDVQVVNSKQALINTSIKREIEQKYYSLLQDIQEIRPGATHIFVPNSLTFESYEEPYERIEEEDIQTITFGDVLTRHGYAVDTSKNTTYGTSYIIPSSRQITEADRIRRTIKEIG